MPKIEQCDRCIFCAHTYQIVCALHPSGVQGENCPDFKPDPELEGKRFVDFLGINANSVSEQWEPDGASYYNDELILHQSRLTSEEQLDLLDWHPIFTGRCDVLTVKCQCASIALRSTGTAQVVVGQMTLLINTAVQFRKIS